MCDSECRTSFVHVDLSLDTFPKVRTETGNKTDKTKGTSAKAQRQAFIAAVSNATLSVTAAQIAPANLTTSKPLLSATTMGSKPNTTVMNASSARLSSSTPVVRTIVMHQEARVIQAKNDTWWPSDSVRYCPYFCPPYPEPDSLRFKEKISMISRRTLSEPTDAFSSFLEYTTGMSASESPAFPVCVRCANCHFTYGLPNRQFHLMLAYLHLSNLCFSVCASFLHVILIFCVVRIGC
ncbi:uncharacterized protein LOC129592434 [Paramacrobiotus metropolitanus]|uniref:uncharacterized protein LOC129592434 n=1 Tax=Paramacrobiotus metropolitanus TaxID=2943436 RepID=UPI0024462F96|nr:uncharacterized protein LOC129592434 [Paramacrobiotus metropolitanus]